MSLILDKIDKQKLPLHIAIIMDGNGRWAKEHGKRRIYGHRQGVRTVKTIVEASAELGIKFLTLYTFSMENWQRPSTEVNALMGLLVSTLKKEIDSLIKNNIRLKTIGDISLLPEKTHSQIIEAIEQTKDNSGTTLIIALSYSSKWDIVNAAKEIASHVKRNKFDIADINESLFASMLSTSGFPNPELLIRTSGETRISNFLLWELAYTELYFTERNWPEFSKDDYFEAILSFQSRERRFGKTSEQIST
jgi:undecaprenyl diphosphate synthase